MQGSIRRIKSTDGTWWKYVGCGGNQNKHYLRCGNTAKFLTADEFKTF